MLNGLHELRFKSIYCDRIVTNSFLNTSLQFDRNHRGKSDSITGLEEVLAQLRPSEFDDEQLSRYKVSDLLEENFY